MAYLSEMTSYQLLGKAIVLQAAEDYGRALLGQHGKYYTKEGREKCNKDMIEECEKFFGSGGHLIYTNIPGDSIINEVRERVKTWPRNTIFTLGNLIEDGEENV